jgi:hypothetical protein
VIEDIYQPHALVVHQEGDPDGGNPEPPIVIIPYDGSPGIDLTQVRGGVHGSVYLHTDQVDELCRALRRAAKEQRARRTK